MGLTDTSYKVDNIVEELFISFKREQVEHIFEGNNIDDKAERVQLLRKCMKVIDVSDNLDSLSIEDEYNDELEIFLEGTWRFLI